MSYVYKYQKWIYDYQQIIYNAKIRDIRRKKLLAALAVIEFFRLKNRGKFRTKRLQNHPLMKLQTEHGFFQAVFPTIASYGDKFENYLRMSTIQFEKLLCLVAPFITKENTVGRTIAADARLLMTLRYLATGDCLTSISHQHLIEETTAANMIAETCKALWDCLLKEVLPYPLNRSDWLRIAHEFEEKWEFQHCIGAIDGKHIQIRCPDDADKDQSIVLLAICDANYSFTFVDIGADGRCSDGIIFRNSEMGHKFAKREMNLPNPKKLTVDGMPLPYVLVGDEAFQSSDYLLRPYPSRSDLNQDQKIFNLRLSRARKTIENVFSIMVSHWGIMKKPMEGTVESVMSTVQAIVCLHNWLCEQDEDNTYIPSTIDDADVPNDLGEELQRGVENSALKDGKFKGIDNSTRSAITVRDEFCHFFSVEGATPWQYSCI